MFCKKSFDRCEKLITSLGQRCSFNSAKSPAIKFFIGISTFKHCFVVDAPDAAVTFKIKPSPSSLGIIAVKSMTVPPAEF